jgi:hypothetical protein
MIKSLLSLLFVLFTLQALPQQSVSATSGSVANCLCVGDLWDVSNQLKPHVTFSASGVSHRVLFTNYNFNIPASATVTGYEVSFSYTSNVTIHTLKDTVVHLLVGGNIAGIAQEASTPNYVGNNTMVIGSPTNIWGVWLAPSQINDPTFGFNFKLYSAQAGVKFGFTNGATITIYYVTASGIRESQSMASKTKLYTDKKNVKISSDLDENSQVSIYNILGSKLMTINLEANSSKEFDLSNLSNGLYVYTIKSGNKERAGKFILE